MNKNNMNTRDVYYYIRYMVRGAYYLYYTEDDPSYGDDQLNEASLELDWLEHHGCISEYNANRIVDLFGI